MDKFYWDERKWMEREAELKKMMYDIALGPPTERTLDYLEMIMEGGEGMVYTNLITYISDRTGDALSTVRWHLKRMRDGNWIIASDRHNKGLPVEITEKGEILLEEYLNHRNSVYPIDSGPKNATIGMYGRDD